MNKKLKKMDYTFLALAIFLMTCYIVLRHFTTPQMDYDYDKKYKAGVLMKNAMAAIREERIKRGIDIDKNVDINDTGIIGVEYSPITTTLGSLESKRTSTNPAFAAVIVDMMREIGLEKGDYIAANFSGSFPALNLAVLSAAETLGVNAVVMSSVGASSYGANIPEFNYTFMEELLYKKGIITTKSIINSLGGTRDLGYGMDENTRQAILSQLRELNRDILLEENLNKNIDMRYRIYQSASGNSIKCFVNVGGNAVSIGQHGDWNSIGSGLIMPDENKAKEVSGLIGKFLSDGIPVINMINIKELALRYGLPIDPSPIPEIQTNNVYYVYNYSKILIMLILIISIAVIYIYGVRIRKIYD